MTCNFVATACHSIGEVARAGGEAESVLACNSDFTVRILVEKYQRLNVAPGRFPVGLTADSP